MVKRMKYVLKNHIDHNANCGIELLKSRGIQDIPMYLNPTDACLNDYLLLDNIVAAVQCLKKHIDAQHKIFIQIDSDADGYTSSAIMYLYIKSIDPEANIVWRVHEGKQHGIICNSIPDDVDLVIIPDAGSNDYEQHKELQDMGVDVIVLDHHIADYESKNAIIVNNQLSEKYPNKALCGAGIVYKFCQCFDGIFNYQNADKFIDLVAVALVGDMMDLRDLETRYLVYKGLKKITNKGLLALVEKQSFSIGDTRNISPTAIAFYIVPLINAIVRVGTTEEKETMFNALIDGDKLLRSTKRGAKPGDCETAGEQTARVATNARNRQNRIKEKAMEELEVKIKKEELYKNQIIFLGIDNDLNFDNTLTGLIAMQIMHKYRKPVLLTRLSDDGYYRGSCRGDSNTELKDLKEYLGSTGMFEYVAGHPNAAGVSLPKASVDSFIEQSNTDLQSIDFGQNMYDVDFVFNGKEDLATPIMALGQLTSLWGQGVAEPYLVVENMVLNKSDFSFIGTNKDTCKFSVNGVTFIRFKDTTMIDKINKLDQIQITIIGRANLNEWCGEVTPQVIIEDYQIIDYSTAF